jgi:hypothetical protein
MTSELLRRASMPPESNQFIGPFLERPGLKLRKRSNVNSGRDICVATARR